MAKINIFKGNNLDFIKTIPNGAIDFIYTDPPYLLETNKKHKINEDKGRELSRVEKTKNNQTRAIKDKNLEDGIDYELYFNEFLRVLKKPVQMLIWCNTQQIPFYLDQCQKNNLKFKILPWIKTNPMPLNNPYYNDIEWGIYIYKSAIYNFKNDYSSKLTYQIHASDREKSNNFHPTTKPYDVVLHHIEKHTQNGMVVLDPFMGGGSTLLACYMNNVKVIGCELDDFFYKKSKEKLYHWMNAVDKINDELKEVKEFKEV